MQFVTSFLVTIFLVVFAGFLAGPAFTLPAYDAQGGVAAGALPQFVVVAVVILAIGSFVADLRRRVRSEGEAEAEVHFDASPTRVVTIGFAVLALLAVFLVAWPRLSFPVAASIFMAALSLLLLPAEQRTVRGALVAVVASIAFCIGVWLAFVHLLAVPLR